MLRRRQILLDRPPAHPWPTSKPQPARCQSVTKIFNLASLPARPSVSTTSTQHVMPCAATIQESVPARTKGWPAWRSQKLVSRLSCTSSTPDSIPFRFCHFSDWRLGQSDRHHSSTCCSSRPKTPLTRAGWICAVVSTTALPTANAISSRHKCCTIASVIVGSMKGGTPSTLRSYRRGSAVARALGATKNVISCLRFAFSARMLSPHMLHPAATQTPPSCIIALYVFRLNSFGSTLVRARQTP